MQRHTRPHLWYRLSLWFATMSMVLGLISPPVAGAAAPANSPINHIVVIYQENHSFDNLLGSLPGANGLEQAKSAAPQADKNGKVYSVLPQPIDTSKKPPAPDPRFPADLANKPFLIDQYVGTDKILPDLIHKFYQNQLQIDGGKNDRFAAWSDAAGLSMGYYDTTKLPLYKYAKDYTVMDDFFQAAFGGSFLNHFWLIAAASPVWPNAPADVIADPVIDAQGKIIGLNKDGQVTPDGYAVNTTQSTYQPHASTIAADHLLPPQTMPTIGDRLSTASVTWAWYSGGWNDALAGKPDPTFQFHHQPLAYFKQYADGTADKAAHLKDETAFFADVDAGNLPAVSFIKPLGVDNEHSGYATVLQGEQHVASIIEKLKQSPYWQDTAIILTYDENGGFWDHVPPPAGDRWGPGTRIPAVVISAYARKGFVDHTQYDTTSILKFIGWRFGIDPLTQRDAKANNMLAAFDFTQKPTSSSSPAAATAPAASTAATAVTTPTQLPKAGELNSGEAFVVIGISTFALFMVLHDVIQRRQPPVN